MAITISPIANMVNAMAIVQSNLSANQSNPSPIELADRAQRRIFVASIIFGVVAAIVAAILATLVWKSNNTYQAAVKSDADARIVEAGERASKADERAAEANLGAAKANEGLAKSNEEIARLTAEAESAKGERAEADRQIAIAKANAARADEGAAKATAEVARLQIVVANAETKRAEAERALLELQERMRPRTVTHVQRVNLRAILSVHPKGEVEIVSSINDQEAQTFGWHLYSALTDAGWTVHKVRQQNFVYPLTGIAVVASNPESNMMAGALQRALIGVGIPTGGLIDPKLPADSVVLVVGSKPQP
ncbi:MAG TPA: hypothetical protein VK388_06325 [Pyrinomonadaceae bacterium]|nr:hypothetical protein [Pyrinomonadaceae bacterium]